MQDKRKEQTKGLEMGRSNLGTGQGMGQGQRQQMGQMANRMAGQGMGQGMGQGQRQQMGQMANRMAGQGMGQGLSPIHISEPTRQAEISYAVLCLKKKNDAQSLSSSTPLRHSPPLSPLHPHHLTKHRRKRCHDARRLNDDPCGRGVL